MTQPKEDPLMGLEKETLVKMVRIADEKLKAIREVLK
jgi:hypothetical protein